MLRYDKPPLIHYLTRFGLYCILALTQRGGTFAVDAFKTVQERLSQDELTAEQEEETKAALDEILAIFQIVQKQEQER